MRARLLIVAALLVGAVAGWLIAPAVLPGAWPPGAPAVRMAHTIQTDQAEATLPLATVGPPPPSPEPVLSPEQTADLAAGVLGREIPPVAGADLVAVPGSVPAPVPTAPEVVQVRVEVEQGLPVDAAVFAGFVMEVLNDPRGWGAGGAMSFARTDGTAQMRVVLASPSVVDQMCAPLRTVSLYSCGRNGHAALNAERWAIGGEPFLAGGGDITAYRQYLVTHEVGHLLGHPHQQCPAAGSPAPVMVQQSMSLEGCLPNAWPNP